MNIDSKETLCSRCIHNAVCSYSNGYLSILKAISETCVPSPYSDLDGSGYKKVTDFDFIGDISVSCRYYQIANNVR